jgi:DNA mismatch repair ATPase MutS
VFLEKFWKVGKVQSFISTHSFELLDALPKHVQPLCCPATEDAETQTIHYSYQVRPGICRLSSVREVLREVGLLA